MRLIGSRLPILAGLLAGIGLRSRPGPDSVLGNLGLDAYGKRAGAADVLRCEQLIRSAHLLHNSDSLRDGLRHPVGHARADDVSGTDVLRDAFPAERTLWPATRRDHTGVLHAHDCVLPDHVLLSDDVLFANGLFPNRRGYRGRIHRIYDDRLDDCCGGGTMVAANLPEVRSYPSEQVPAAAPAAPRTSPRPRSAPLQSQPTEDDTFSSNVPALPPRESTNQAAKVRCHCKPARNATPSPGSNA